MITNRSLIAMAVLGALSLTIGNTFAQTSNWIVDASGNWNTGANWSAGVPNGVDAIADFSTIDITATRTITLDINPTVGTLILGETGTQSNLYTFSPLTTSTLTFATSSGTPTINAINTNVTPGNVGFTHVINSTIAGTQGLILTGSGLNGGVVRANGANTFTGGLTLNKGRFTAGNLAGFGAGSVTVNSGSQANLAVGGTYTNPFFLSSNFAFGLPDAGLAIRGNGITINSTVTLTGAGRINARGVSGANITGQITGSNALELGFNGNGSTATNGRLTLSNTTNNWTGDTTIGDGRLLLGASEVIPHGAGAGNVIIDGNTGDGNDSSILDLNGQSETVNGLSSTGNAAFVSVTNGAAPASSLTVGGNNANGNFAGVISNGTGTVALVKTGTGTQTLSGANTYTGTTTVSGGTLAVNGSLNAASAVILNGGALGGTGTVGAVTLGSTGVLAPGNSPGTLNGGSLAWDGGGVMNFELDTVGGSDLLNLSGAFNEGAAGSFLFNFTELAGFGAGTYTLVNFASTTFSVSDFSQAGISGGFNSLFALNANNLQLIVTVVPEPSTYAMLLGGAMMLFMMIRRRTARTSEV